MINETEYPLWSCEYVSQAMKYWVYEGNKLALSISDKDQAQRIVAAMNAVRGVPTELIGFLNISQ